MNAMPVGIVMINKINKEIKFKNKIIIKLLKKTLNFDTVNFKE